MFCSACGTEITEGNAFCHNCGKKVGVHAGNNEAVVMPRLQNQGSYPQERKKKIKGLKSILLITCLLVGVIGIVGYVGYRKKIEASFDPDGSDTINKLSYSVGVKESELNNYVRDDSLAFHIDKADGVFTLWSCNVYDDGDNIQRDGEWLDEDAFSGALGVEASKNADITFYMVTPNGIVNECPISSYGGEFPGVRMTGFASYIGSTGDGKYANTVYGEYRIVMVAKNVKNVDLVFNYGDALYYGSDFSYQLYYPGEYSNNREYVGGTSGSDNRDVEGYLKDYMTDDEYEDMQDFIDSFK